MDAVAYDRFTRELTRNLEADPRVIGLVAAGSMAGTHHQPDQWSDHDFLVVTHPGAEEEFRSSTGWLPDYLPIALHFKETQHGLKLVYEDGHLLEYAIFNAEDFRLVKLNAHRILIDREGFGELVEQVLADTQRSTAAERPTNEHLLGQLLTHCLVGATRYARGEHLSGHRFVKNFALQDLLQLIEQNIPTEGQPQLDNLDPFRRFERAYPKLAVQIEAALQGDPAKAAADLLSIAEASLPVWEPAAASAVRRVLNTIE